MDYVQQIKEGIINVNKITEILTISLKRNVKITLKSGAVVTGKVESLDRGVVVLENAPMQHVDYIIIDEVASVRLYI
jgi:small nuclear ribonucleoprotein (snRNP)-like protein